MEMAVIDTQYRRRNQWFKNNQPSIKWTIPTKETLEEKVSITKCISVFLFEGHDPLLCFDYNGKSMGFNLLELDKKRNWLWMVTNSDKGANKRILGTCSHCQDSKFVLPLYQSMDDNLTMMYLDTDENKPTYSEEKYSICSDCLKKLLYEYSGARSKIRTKILSAII